MIFGMFSFSQGSMMNSLIMLKYYNFKLLSLLKLIVFAIGNKSIGIKNYRLSVIQFNLPPHIYLLQKIGIVRYNQQCAPVFVNGSG